MENIGQFGNWSNFAKFHVPNFYYFLSHDYILEFHKIYDGQSSVVVNISYNIVANLI